MAERRESKDRRMRPYHLPPEGYSSPSIDPGCSTCGEPIIFVGVMGGEMWCHLIHVRPEPHTVTMATPWWDVVTGEFVEGNPLLPVDRSPQSGRHSAEAAS